MGKSTSVSANPLAFQSAARRRQVLRKVEPERHRELLLLDGRDVEVRGGCDPPFRQLDAVVDRLHGARAEDLPGHELGRHDRRRELLEQGLPVPPEPEQEIRHDEGHQPRQRAPEIRRHGLDVGIPRPQGIGRLHERRPQPAAEHRLDLLGGGGDDRLFGLRARGYTMDSRTMPMRMPSSVPGAPGIRAWLAYGVLEHRRARHGRVRVPRVVVALDRILQGVEDLGAIADRAAEDAGAVAVDIRADGAPVETQHRLVRKDERHRIVVGRSATGRPRLLAEAGHHQIGADRHARPRARAERGGAGGVVGIRGIAAPGAALVAQHRRQDLVGSVAAAGISRPPVVFRVDGLGEDDRPLGAELLDEQMIARGEVDVVARVTPGGGAHVLRVEGVLEREHDAIHRHRREIGMAPIHVVELGRALEGVREPAEHLAHGGRAGGKRPRGRVPVEVAPAGDRTLTPDVEGGERIHLPRVRLADDHPELLLHVGIGGRRLHAAVFEGRPLVLVEIGQDGGGLDGFRGKAQRHPSRARRPSPRAPGHRLP